MSALIGLLLASASASAQFGTVINVPPDVAPPSIGSSTQLNLSDGGVIGSNFSANAGSEVNISGGVVGSGFSAFSNSAVRLSGGTVGPTFQTSFADLEIVGGEFRLNGADFNGPSFFLLNSTSSTGDVFSGVLEDGSPFIFTLSAGDRLRATLTEANVPAADPSPIVVDAANPTGPAGLRVGQSLTLSDGGALGDNFAVIESRLTVEGGTVGAGAELAGSRADLLGGSIGPDFAAHSGSVVNIDGSILGSRFLATPGSVVNLSSGEIGTGSRALSQSVVNVSGGVLGRSFQAQAGSRVKIRGGDIGDQFDAFGGSEVRLVGREFTIDGEPIDGLIEGESQDVTQRDVVLSGRFADGSAFSFDLSSTNTTQNGFFSPGATLNVTLVPEPSAAALLLMATVAFARRRRPR